MGGGSSWDEHSSLLACKGYERASENGKKGSGMKKLDFSKAVYEEYAGFVRDAEDSDASWITPRKAQNMLKRTPLAVVTHVKKVKTDCLKFDGLIGVVKAARPTGDPKEEDIQRAATAMFNGEGTVSDMYRYIRGEEAPSKPFPRIREYAWYQCTNSALLLEKRACRQTGEGSSSSDGSTSPGSEGGIAAASAAAVNEAVGKKGFVRPTGNKRALTQDYQNKSIAKGSAGIASMAEAAHKRTKLGEEALSIERKKAETEHMKATIQLFSMEGCCPNLREKAFKMLRKKALAEILSSGGSGGGGRSEGDGITGGQPLASSAVVDDSDDEAEEVAPGETDSDSSSDA